MQGYEDTIKCPCGMLAHEVCDTNGEEIQTLCVRTCQVTVLEWKYLWLTTQSRQPFRICSIVSLTGRLSLPPRTHMDCLRDSVNITLVLSALVEEYRRLYNQ